MKKIIFYVNETIEIINKIEEFSIAEIIITRTGKKIIVSTAQIKETIDGSSFITPTIYKRQVI